MLIQKFRTAAKVYGDYSPDKNELRFRKGRKLYRITCREHGLVLVVPTREQVLIDVAADATVRELRRGIASIIELCENA